MYMRKLSFTHIHIDKGAFMEPSIQFTTNRLLFSVHESIATLTFNDPEHLNPIDADIMKDIGKCISYIEECDDVKVLILRGAGGNFSAGGNIRGMQERIEQGINSTKSGIRAGGETIMRLRTLSKPTIACVEGAVAGAGMSLMMACDFSIVDESAKMVFAFVNIGFVPDGGITYMLTKAVGTVKATELLLSGRKFTGREAADWGIVTEAVSNDKLEMTVNKYAKKYSEGPSIAYAQIKKLIQDNCYRNINACMQNEVTAQYICSRTHDHKEAIDAFIEKRRPQFIGK